MPTSPLPQLDRLFLTDSGQETDAIFNEGLDLPCFAAITLLRSDQGRAYLDRYFRRHIAIAREAGTGFLLESSSWRGSPDWAGPIGLSQAELDDLNRQSITMLHDLRSEHADADMPMVVSGCIGPRGDGYDPGTIMTIAEAEAYHGHQAAVLASAGPDMLAAMTMNNVNEAAGIARAARRTGLPVAISFTLETDGRLPTGDALADAIAAVDAATDGYPAYFMINCAHPSHFDAILDPAEQWTRRIRGIRANASRCSHAELEAMTELDAGDPEALGAHYRALRSSMPWLTVLGGCCGTDIRHIAAIAEGCMMPA